MNSAFSPPGRPGPSLAAQRLGLESLRLNPGQGVAAARNRGAALARGELQRALLADDSGILGSYDDQPQWHNICSLYANLRQHYVHQQGSRLPATFWAGCRALRREALLEAGGFNESYRNPSIEHSELGMRLSAAGHRIVLAHYANWSPAMVPDRRRGGLGVE